MPDPRIGIPIRHELMDVPFFPQQDHQCGPAALAAALQWTGVNVSPFDLSSEVYTPSLQGSLQSALTGAARRHGRVAYAIYGTEELLIQVAAGHPVLVLQNLALSWHPVWHYAVVVGYDLQSQSIVLRSGQTARKEISFQLFSRTWARSQQWAICVLSPTQLPERPDEWRYLEAILGLEKAGRFAEAIDGYRTALTCWPQSFAASMGIGNSFYALRDLNQAADALRTTVRLHPAQSAAYNNLAQVLGELGLWQEALQAARKAVTLGGPMQPVYVRTLNQIENTTQKTADQHPVN
jgi:tetratricopeptide (TPR) repeat protein